ncbi:MAG: DUF3570 domain-containing protein [Chlorobi bacterium]|nr:DUF3570 domain-containing protein [Chlorobiota bacterium]
MKIFTASFVFVFSLVLYGQNQNENENTVFRKKVLDNTEVHWLLSVYGQNGENAAVTGGIGNEELNDFAQNIQVAIPVNTDNIMNLDITISGYTSASSSNLNPFDKDDDAKNRPEASAHKSVYAPLTGSPWVASSGASRKDVWINFNVGYTHYSGDRNRIYGAGLGVAKEFDYFSKSGHLSYTALFNEKNTEISLGTKFFLDKWNPQYPIEIKTFIKNDGDLNADLFYGVPILDQNGTPTDKNSTHTWRPAVNEFLNNKNRNTYVLSLSFSQILSPRAQMAVMTDITYQTGWLANPMQRVYFADKPNYYIGKAEDIAYYTNPKNTGVFQLADAYEKLPASRLKFPVGIRLHYYINEYVVLRTYYRYYFDTWGIHSNTLEMELPLKISGKFTLYPSYRYYNQTAADYFAPYEEHLSTEKFYTSDYDLSAFSAHQAGFGVKYTDIFTSHKIWKLAIKSIMLDFDHYMRSTGFKANIISLNMNLVAD